MCASEFGTFGRPIAREDFSSLDPTPGHTRARDTASWFGRRLSEGFNWLTGGTAYKPGTFSPTPDQIDYLLGQLGGGVAREVLKASATEKALRTGEELPLYKVPLVGRFFGAATGTANESARFYENVRTINMHKNEIDGRRKDKLPIADYLRDNPEARLQKLSTDVQKQVRDLRKVKKQLIERGASSAQVRAIDERIAAAMARLNDRVEALQE